MKPDTMANYGTEPTCEMTSVPVDSSRHDANHDEKCDHSLERNNHSDEEPHENDDVNAEHKLLADPSGIKLGKYVIPPRVVAPICALLIFAGGVLFAFTTPIKNNDPKPWNRISAVIGWIYFLAWGVSFLPQLYFNMRRRSVVGQSFEFVYLNIVGFLCYSVYTLCFYANDNVNNMYKDRHNGSSNNVALNDVVFAVYALVCCLLNGLQIIFFDRGGQKMNILATGLIVLIFFVIVLWTCLIAGGVKRDVFFNYLDLLYGLSLVKLGISIVKYVPQVYLNYKRKCTIGWNIWNILLDFTGGILSILQEVIDSWVTSDWEGMKGNPVKFALGSVSILYDLVFFVQHFLLYNENNKRLALPDHFHTREFRASEKREEQKSENEKMI
ncbi:cystinosin [Trypanosoma cruzi Dm28c]|uniref:Cystinosin n=2 Tax=Trypanosoma cruzi TaxID=5693 RepID=V5BJ02_TRYCR|nr:cystinosin [Trypanosoma cruzi Dm28c]PWU93689.1 putative cystinosin [Trypanosoma cruzi]